MSKENNSVRIGFIDVFKGLGILLVIIHHCTNVAGGYTLGKFILSFHMPLFFFASGYLYSRKTNWSSFFASKVKGLILPLILYSIINSCIIIVCALIGLERYVDNLQLGGFWFIIALFVAEIIYYFIESATLDKGKKWGGGTLSFDLNRTNDFGVNIQQKY